MSREQKLSVLISEQDVFDNIPLYKTHIEYIAARFKKDHGVLVLKHKELLFDMAPNNKMMRYTGVVGKSLSARVS